MIKAKELPSQQYLQECFNYDYETGNLIWRNDRPIHHFKNEYGMNVFNSNYGGEIAGTQKPKDYRYIKVNDVKLLAHILIWKFHTGKDPQYQIDHIDRFPSNNRIENLRDVTPSDNMLNTKTRTNNSSGTKGVHYSAKHNKWIARLNVRGNSIHLGLFVDKEDAIKTRLDAELKDWSHLEDIKATKIKAELTLDYLNERLEYKDGYLYWKEADVSYFKTQGLCDKWNNKYANKTIQTKSDEYKVVTIQGKKYRQHRLIYWMCTGIKPPDDMIIDHISGVKNDNRIENLRLCSPSQNSQNRGNIKSSTSGFKGVSMNNTGKFTSSITHNKQTYFLGAYTTPEEAYRAYQKAATELHGNYANFG